MCLNATWIIDFDVLMRKNHLDTTGCHLCVIASLIPFHPPIYLFPRVSCPAFPPWSESEQREAELIQNPFFLISSLLLIGRGKWTSSSEEERFDLSQNTIVTALCEKLTRFHVTGLTLCCFKTEVQSKQSFSRLVFDI